MSSFVAAAAGLIALALAPAVAPVASAAPHAYRAPRTAYGQPDLQGYWNTASLTQLQRQRGAPLSFATRAEEQAFEAQAKDERAQFEAGGLGQGVSEWHPAYAFARIGGRLRTSWIVEPADGRLPYSAAGRARWEAADAANNRTAGDGPESRPPAERCLVGGFGSNTPPMMNPAVAAGKQIVQTRDEVAILSEMNHDVRIVRLGAPGRPARHLPPGVRVWMGDSIGRWEGDTLVVETTNFHPQEIYRGVLLMSPDAKVTERFRRLGPGALSYAFEVDDPAVFSRVWRAEMIWRADREPMFEFACHEGNYGLPDILAAARRADARPR